ncbi:hypothetical protein D082_33810 [Synechocystis sp. PCC 6714]|nr:hypothetical protein D082_33810 [Synechocystis sp. PCC 6714]
MLGISDKLITETTPYRGHMAKDHSTIARSPGSTVQSHH